MHPGQGRVVRLNDCEPAARCASAPDLAAAGWISVPRQGEISVFIRRRRETGNGRFHGGFSGAMGRGGTEPYDHRTGLENETELVRDQHLRQEDPAPCPSV